MQDLKKMVKVVLAKKNLGTLSTGSYILNVIQKFFNDTSIEGYLRNDVFFVKIINPAIKIKIFKDKPKILYKVNE